MRSRAFTVGSALLALAALLLAFEVWGIVLPLGPVAMGPGGLLEAGSRWPVHAATLGAAAALVLLGGWLIWRGSGRDGAARGE